MKNLCFPAGLLALTLAALAAAAFWGIRPLSALGGLRNMDSTPTGLVQQRVPIHFVSPNWISGKDNLEIERKWSVVETIVRLAIVFITWFVATIFLHRRTRLKESNGL